MDIIDTKNSGKVGHPYDLDGRCYHPSKEASTFSIDGIPCQSRILEVDYKDPDVLERFGAKLRSPDWGGDVIEPFCNFKNSVRYFADTERFPTGKRAIELLSPDLSKKHDLTIVLNVGFGETTAQFSLVKEEALKIAREMGYKNPLFAGVNLSGRATPEYMANTDRVARIGFMDEINEARTMFHALYDLGYLSEENVFIGHSMGNLNSMAMAEELAILNNILKEKGAVRSRISGVSSMMPVSDEPFGLAKSPRFLRTIKEFVRPAISQFLRRKGAIDLNPDQYNRAMFDGMGNEEDSRRASLRGNPDSATRFLGVTLNPRRRFDLRRLKGVRFSVMQGARDIVIPNKMVQRWDERLGENLGTDRGTFVESPYFSHGMPSFPSANQRHDVRMFLEGAIGKMGEERPADAMGEEDTMDAF